MTSTRTCIAAAAIVLVCLSQQCVHGDVDREQSFALYKKCQEQTKAEESHDDLVDKRLIPSSDAGKCMIECILTDLQVMKDGKLDYESSLKAADRLFGDNQEKAEMAVKIVEECKDIEVSGLDGCDVAAKFLACTQERKPTIFD